MPPGPDDWVIRRGGVLQNVICGERVGQPDYALAHVVSCFEISLHVDGSVGQAQLFQAEEDMQHTLFVGADDDQILFLQRV
ncbi:hypothetical protein MTO96_024778 [Rhipicephalus appendiculatus]